MAKRREKVDLNDILSDQGKEKIKVGEVMVFNNNGVKTSIKVTKASIKTGFHGVIIPNLLTTEDIDDVTAKEVTDAVLETKKETTDGI